MHKPSQQISIIGLLSIIACAAIAIVVIKWLSGNWAWGIQAVILTPILLLYVFSWTILVLLAPALVAVSPGVRAAPILRWFLAVVVGAAECLFVVLWMEADSLPVLILLGLLFAGIWLGASMALREYSEML